MAVYRANLKKLRKLVAERQTVIGTAIGKLDATIAKGKAAKRGTSQAEKLQLHKKSLGDAKRVLKALKQAQQALEDACCHDTLNCDIEVP